MDLTKEAATVWLHEPARHWVWCRERYLNEAIEPSQTMFPGCQVVAFTKSLESVVTHWQPIGESYIGLDRPKVVRVFYRDVMGDAEGLSQDAPPEAVRPVLNIRLQSLHPSRHREKTVLGLDVVESSQHWHNVFRDYWTTHNLIEAGPDPTPAKGRQLDYTTGKEISITWLSPEFKKARWLLESVMGRPQTEVTPDYLNHHRLRIVAYGVSAPGHCPGNCRVWAVPIESDPFGVPEWRPGWHCVRPPIAGQASKPPRRFNWPTSRKVKTQLREAVK